MVSVFQVIQRNLVQAHKVSDFFGLHSKVKYCDFPLIYKIYPILYTNVLQISDKKSSKF